LAERESSQAGKQQRSPRGSTAEALRELELALIRASDGTFVVSDSERAIVAAHAPSSAVWVVQTMHEVRSASPTARGLGGVIFVGGFKHPPNVDAAVRLLTRVMPIVWRRLGPIAVTIVGGSVPEEVLTLASAHVEVTGWLAELDSLLDKARALVAPLTWGGRNEGQGDRGSRRWPARW
jgi:hypothetical protein